MACLSGPDLGANKSANGYNDQENRCQGEPLAHTSHTGMTERAAMPFAGMITSHQADLTVRLVSATGYSLSIGQFSLALPEDHGSSAP